MDLISVCKYLCCVRVGAVQCHCNCLCLRAKKEITWYFFCFGHVSPTFPSFSSHFSLPFLWSFTPLNSGKHLHTYYYYFYSFSIFSCPSSKPSRREKGKKKEGEKIPLCTSYSVLSVWIIYIFLSLPSLSLSALLLDK